MRRHRPSPRPDRNAETPATTNPRIIRIITTLNRFISVTESSSRGRLPSPGSHTTWTCGSASGGSQVDVVHQITRFRPDLKAWALHIFWRVGVAFNPWTDLSTPGVLSRSPYGPLRQGIPHNGLFCCSVRTHNQRFLPQLEFRPSAASLRLGLSVCSAFRLWSASLASPDLPLTMPSADFSSPVPCPRGPGSLPAGHEISPGKAHDFHASTRRIYTNAFRSGIGL